VCIRREVAADADGAAQPESGSGKDIAISREEMFRFLLWLRGRDGPPTAVAREYVRLTGDPMAPYRERLWEAAAVAGRRPSPRVLVRVPCARCPDSAGR
jgi:hypothetical protein